MATESGSLPQRKASGPRPLLPADSGSFAPMAAPGRGTVLLNALLALLLLYVFLVGVECLSSGIKGLGGGVMNRYLGEDMNPFLGLVVGILATTLVQSSSVSTSLIVGLVASGEVPVASAVPMVMGANIGTTVTNTIASLAHSTGHGEFRRAFAAATCHDFFNFLAVITLLPLELITRWAGGVGFLELSARVVAGWTTGGGGVKYDSPLKLVFKAGRQGVQTAVEAGLGKTTIAAVALSVVGVLIIFGALTGIVKVMRALVLTRLESYVNRFLGRGGLVAILVGIVLTVMVQSSSITTSVLVPLAGAGLMTVTQIYPITLGANIGTTITALLASLAVSGPTAEAARQIALVHLGFNLLGTLVWYGPPPLRRVPVRLAEGLAGVATQSRRWAIVYVALVFYGLPAIIFFVSRALSPG